ncbi:MAG: CPBP family intramembrane metalloprotease [Anaerolineales bacterium]|nr:CPBP family intramembrane metalloprotease [Anaerolineales bacterium]
MVITREGVSENVVHDIPQYTFWQILLMFSWPAVWFSFLIYVVARPFIPEGGVTPTWVLLAVIVLGTGAELAAGLVLLRREGYALTVAALRDRIRWQWPKGWRAWLIALAVLVAGMVLSMMMGGANRALASVPGFVPPDWWPAASNPTVQISGVAEAFPDVALQGNWLFVLLYFVIGLVFNIFGEEIYYRGFLMPKMRAVFGRWDWVANGILFTLKHVYQRWLFPAILVSGLGFAFAFGPLGSLPLAMVFHWIGNFLFQMVFLVMAAFGIG